MTSNTASFLTDQSSSLKPLLHYTAKGDDVLWVVARSAFAVQPNKKNEINIELLLFLREDTHLVPFHNAFRSQMHEIGRWVQEERTNG